MIPAMSGHPVNVPTLQKALTISIGNEEMVLKIFNFTSHCVPSHRRDYCIML
jgi:hypothetical protein